MMGIKGIEKLKSATVHSRHDHRIAMAHCSCGIESDRDLYRSKKQMPLINPILHFFMTLEISAVSVHILR